MKVNFQPVFNMDVCVSRVRQLGKRTSDRTPTENKRTIVWRVASPGMFYAYPLRTDLAMPCI